MGDPKLPAFRALDDFCFGSARFSMPHVEDGDRLANRVVRNLLYYQTNYLVLYGLIFLLMGFYYPYRVFGGAFLVFGGFVVWKAVVNKPGPKGTKESSLQLLLLLGILTIIYFLGFVLVFFASVILPLAAILLHASCRKRNLKNQLNWVTERAGLRTTIMAAILMELGTRLDIEVESDAASR